MIDAPTAKPNAASSGDPPSSPAICVDSLTHSYAARTPRRRRRHNTADAEPAAPLRDRALDHVSLTVEPGEVFGILGPNGSGKTTLFRILATMLRPNSDDGERGELSVFGYDVRTQPQQVRQVLGVVFQSPSLDGQLTARENLHHQGHLYGLSGAPLRQRADELLTYFGLGKRGDEKVDHFSGGMRRRVELAKALLHDPRLLLLDEPATGLDPGARHDLWRQLEELRQQRGQTVALTTHLMDEAERCDRLAILAEGRVVATDTPANLKAMIGGDVICLAPKPDGGDLDELRGQIESRFGPWANAAAPAVVAGQIRLEKPNGAAFIADLTEAFPARFEKITVGQPTLEDVFLHLTGHTLWEADR